MITPQPPTETTLLQIIADLRALGFFANFAASDSAVVLRHIQAYYGLNWLDVLAQAHTPAALDQLLLLPDRSRVWCRDLECVYPGEMAYATTIEEWASISRGVFQPTDVLEQWHTPHGPVEVTWTAQGCPFRLRHQDGHDDFLHHLALMHLVNQGITNSAYRLVACDDYPGDCRFVVMLRGTEQPHLQRQRSWSFCVQR